MDENENNGNEIEPEQRLPAADEDVMKSEGVELEGENNTPAELSYVPKPTLPPPPFTPIAPKTEESEKPLEKKDEGFTLITKLPPQEEKTVLEKPAYGISDEPARDVSSADGNFIKPIRTYRSDAEEAVRKDHTSVIDIAVAESKKKEKNPAEYEKAKKTPKSFWFSLVLVFIALGVIAGTYYFWVVGSRTLEQTSAQNFYAPLITAESTQTIPLDPKNPLGSLASAISGSGSAPVGGIIDIIPTGANGIAIATSSDLFSSLGINLPTQVTLSLNGIYMLGTLVSNPNHPFIILGVSSFENAFAGMLSWEKTMRSDFGGLINIDHPNEPLVATTPEIFNDTTISNQDVREILDASSTPLLLYTFVGTTKLVITTDSSTMSAVVTGLNTTNTTR